MDVARSIRVGLAAVLIASAAACGTRTSLLAPFDGGAGGSESGNGDGDGDGDGSSDGGAPPSTVTSGPGSVVSSGANGSTGSANGSSSGGSVSVSTSVGASVAASSSSGVPTELGCADGTREAFRDTLAHPDIAACSGSFRIVGLSCQVQPACGRGAGNDGAFPQGEGCNAEDLCESGWHVCLSSTEVGERSVNGCLGAIDAPVGTFYATRQSGPGTHHCATCGGNECLEGCGADPEVSTNDLFGCGNVGRTPDASCGVLDRASDDVCKTLPPSWSCGIDGYAELENVQKLEPDGGGVLCCRD